MPVLFASPTQLIKRTTSSASKRKNRQPSFTMDEHDIGETTQRLQAVDLLGTGRCSSPPLTVLHSDEPPSLLPCTSSHFPWTITPATLNLALSGSLPNQSSPLPSVKIFDCRYPYEFDGGRVAGAVNISEKEQLENLLFPLDGSVSPLADSILVFYCEFSQKRGPTWMKFVRDLDRRRNDYPMLSFPHMYLLQGGFKEYHLHARALLQQDLKQGLQQQPHQQDDKEGDVKEEEASLEAQAVLEQKGLGYVPMLALEHTEECTQFNRAWDRMWGKRKGSGSKQVNCKLSFQDDDC